ncbi:MAG: hypothetical protein QXJ59_10845 [Thermofilaceae archaeon]
MRRLFFMILEVGVTGVYFGADDRPLVLFVAENRGRLYAFKRWIAKRDYRFTKLQLADVARKKGVQCIFPSSLSVTKTALYRRLEKTGMKLGKAYAAVNLLPPRLREAVRGGEWVLPRYSSFYTQPKPVKFVERTLSEWPSFVLRNVRYVVKNNIFTAAVFRNSMALHCEGCQGVCILNKRFPPLEVSKMLLDTCFEGLFPKAVRAFLEKRDSFKAEDLDFLLEVAALYTILKGGR